MSGDAYEQKYMAGSGAVLHRQKVHAPRWALAIALGVPFAASALMSIAAGIAAGSFYVAMLPLLGGTAYVAFMGALFAVFAGGRIAVSEGELHVQIGPAGPRVAIADIESCTIGPSGLNGYGLGATMLLDGTTVYKMLGKNATSVHVRRRNGKPIVLVCQEPEAVLRAIEEARARLASGVPKTRVELADEEPEDLARDQRREDR